MLRDFSRCHLLLSTAICILHILLLPAVDAAPPPPPPPAANAGPGAAASSPNNNKSSIKNNDGNDNQAQVLPASPPPPLPVVANGTTTKTSTNVSPKSQANNATKSSTASIANNVLVANPTNQITIKGTATTLGPTKTIVNSLAAAAQRAQIRPTNIVNASASVVPKKENMATSANATKATMTILGGKNISSGVVSSPLPVSVTKNGTRKNGTGAPNADADNNQPPVEAIGNGKENSKSTEMDADDEYDAVDNASAKLSKTRKQNVNSVEEEEKTDWKAKQQQQQPSRTASKADAKAEMRGFIASSAQPEAHVFRYLLLLFLSMGVLYVCAHNRKKIMACILEGRSKKGGGRAEPRYRRLSQNERNGIGTTAGGAANIS